LMLAVDAIEACLERRVGACGAIVARLRLQPQRGQSCDSRGRCGGETTEKSTSVHTASLEVCSCWIGDIWWRITLRPIVFLARKIRAVMRVHVCGDIERLTVAQRAGRIERHVAADELGRGTDSRHP